MLEINERPRRDLKALIELIGQRRVERELNVHRTTIAIARWLAGQVAMPRAQHLAVRELLGRLPGTCGKWEGWRFHDGQLLSPAGDVFSPGDVLSLILLRQQLSAQRQELERLKVRLTVAESGHMHQAANDTQLRA
jgi:hypothetical protein